MNPTNQNEQNESDGAQAQAEAEMLANDITETISLLDELRGKATQGNWKNADQPYCEVHRIDKSEDVEYIIALHNNYEALRQAALDGERYRKAWHVLVKAIEENEDTVDYFVKKIVLEYRQILEQKEV